VLAARGAAVTGVVIVTVSRPARTGTTVVAVVVGVPAVVRRAVAVIPGAEAVLHLLVKVPDDRGDESWPGGVLRVVPAAVAHAVAHAVTRTMT
jgi:hypothetical protein